MSILLTLALTTLLQTPPPPPAPPQLPSAAPTRDVPLRAPTGVGAISGMVTTDDATPVPLRNALVHLRADGFRIGWSFVTDATGRFTFKGLPAGRYTLDAARTPYVATVYGAKRPGRPGQAFVLADGASREDIVIRMPKGAVVSGTVRDDTGRPVPNTGLTLFQFTNANGQRTLSRVFLDNQQIRTDDRGVYRIYGITPGEYAVAVGGEAFIFSGGPRLRRVSAQEIDAALKGEAVASTRPAANADESLAKADVFYPGTTVAADAGSIMLVAGEERDGIDITMQFVRAVNVRGVITTPDGTWPSVVTLTMSQLGSATGSMRPLFASPNPRDNSFTFSGVLPGQYLIAARATPAAGSTGDTGTWFGKAEITLSGQPIPPITLALERGVTVSGTVHSGADLATALPTGVRVGLEPVLGRNEVAIGISPVGANADGTFVIPGVAPGRYRVSAFLSSTDWSIRAVTAGDRNITDDGIEIGADTSGIDVTMTDRTTEVSGLLQSPSGAAASDYYIIVFPADAKLWTRTGGRIRSVRPGNDGRFIVRTLPPGDYRIAAVTDVENGEWFEPTFLQQLVAASATLTLTEGEKKSFPLKLGGG